MNHAKYQTYGEWVVSVLPAVVTDYAQLSFAWKRGGAVEINFTRDEQEILLHFHSDAHIELWCESCERSPDLIPELFKRRMVK